MNGKPRLRKGEEMKTSEELSPAKMRDKLRDRLLLNTAYLSQQKEDKDE